MIVKLQMSSDYEEAVEQLGYNNSTLVRISIIVLIVLSECSLWVKM